MCPSGTGVYKGVNAEQERFAHGATSTKVELPVRFPSSLNMRPYVAEEGDPGSATGEHDLRDEHVDYSNDLPDALYQYDLFCVVTHEGKLDNGHYWADVLSEGEWWHCDDDKGMSSLSLAKTSRQDGTYRAMES